MAEVGIWFHDRGVYSEDSCLRLLRYNNWPTAASGTHGIATFARPMVFPRFPGLDRDLNTASLKNAKRPKPLRHFSHHCRIIVSKRSLAVHSRRVVASKLANGNCRNLPTFSQETDNSLSTRLMSLENNHLVKFEDFTLDLEERTLWSYGRMIPLAPKVMDTLCLLAKNAGRLLSKQEMMDKLWADTFVEERNLTQNIFTLRKVLGDGETGKRLIETVPRRGYRFVAEVQPVEAAEHLHVSHRKQTKITAEGYASPRELTDAMNEVALTVSEPSNQSSGVITREARFSRQHLFIFGIGFAALLTMGSVLWGWQQGAIPFSSRADDSRVRLSFERLTDSGKVFFPTISPDEQSFAYVLTDRENFTVELQNVASGSRTVVLGPTDQEIGRPRFSSDGNYLFYRGVSTRGDPGTVYRIPIFGGTPRAIAAGLLSDPSVSPDGEWLAFIRNSAVVSGQELVICRSTDGSEERVVATRVGNRSFRIWNFSPSWSPDGKKVFVGLSARPTVDEPDARSEGFGLMNIEDGTFERVNTPQWEGFAQAEWMPDGRTIVFLAKENSIDPYQVWMVDYPAGTGSRVTNDAHDYRFFSVPAGGGFILATQERTSLNLWSIPVADPGKAKQLTFSSEIQHGQRGIAWTPDGQHIVYTVNESPSDTNLWKLNIETLEKKQLTFDSRTMNWFPNVTPGGSILFTSSRGKGTHVWTMDQDGGSLSQITHGISEGFSNATSDGEWLVYASPAWDPESLWKKSLTDSTEPIKLVSGAGGSNSPSPDGRQIVVSYKVKSDNGNLVYRYGLMPFAHGEQPEDLGFNPYLGAIAWTSDRPGFYYLRDLGMNLSNIWYYDLGDRSHSQVTDFDDQMFSLSLSPDGSTLATARGETVSNAFRIGGF